MDLKAHGKRASDWFIYLLVRVFVCVAQALTLKACQRFARQFAVVLNDVLGIRRRVIDDNLRHAFPKLTLRERRDLSRRMWQHLLLLICEVVQAPRKIHETNWRQHVQLVQRRQLVRLMLSPRPVVAVTGHLGNFEMCGYLAGLLGFPTYTIARPLDNPFLNDFLIQFRAATGQFILPTKGSAEAAQRIVAAGETLAILGDHFAGRKGCWVDFFGRPASCHKSIALFALTNNAPLAVVYARRTGQPLQFEFGMVDHVDPASCEFEQRGVPELTQWYNRHLEAVIQESPDQYWWLHRRWKDPRQRARKRKRKRVDGTGDSARVSHPSIEPRARVA